MPQTGIDEDYYSSFESRFDLLVEAEVAQVTAAVGGVPEVVGVSSLRVEADVPPGSDDDGLSRVRVFRLPGQLWSQACSPWRAEQPFELARVMSERLATRCLQVETTADGWAGHALYDRGGLLEIDCCCFGIDLPGLCSRFGVPLPDRELDQEDLYDTTSLFHSRIRPQTASDNLESLAGQLGFWLDVGHAVWDAEQEVERLDLLFAV